MPMNKLEDLEDLNNSIKNLEPNLPASIPIGPELAFFLAADEKEFRTVIDHIENTSGERLGKHVKGIATSSLGSVINPLSFGGVVKHGAQSIFYMFKHAADTSKAESSRNLMAWRILEMYQLTEIAPQKYALVLGKKEAKPHYTTHGIQSSVSWNPRGLDPNLDLEVLKKLVDPAKQVRGGR